MQGKEDNGPGVRRTLFRQKSCLTPCTGHAERHKYRRPGFILMQNALCEPFSSGRSLLLRQLRCCQTWKEGGQKSMSYLDSLKKNANYKKTLNGAKTHGTTGDACLDLFSVAGGMRHRNPAEIIRLFDRAYIENPDLAMKLLFYIRDIREGLGEREIFRTLIRHVAKVKSWRKSVRKNVGFIAEYGRFDDLFCLMGTSCQKIVTEIIRKQLEEDEKALQKREEGDLDAHISLLAKWMPSATASSARTRGQARVLQTALGMKAPDYRKMLSRLRAAISVTERLLSSGKADKICYEAVPSGAMLKYRNAFSAHDRERFGAYLESALLEEKKIHSDTLFPYDILRPYFQNNHFNISTNVEGEDVLELLWDNLPGAVGDTNAISVIDTSGSMYCSRRGNPKPALISQALGLYYAQHCKGVFHNKFITFNEKPHLIEIHGATLKEQLSYISTAPWGWSTNLEAVFDLILTAAVDANAGQDEMPRTLYIVSDMEFNCAVQDPDKTVFENAEKLFQAFGYRLPAVVFHNVNSWQMQAPVTAYTKGTALTSGAGTRSFNYKFDGNITPMDHMLRVLGSKRYKPIQA